MKRTVAFISRRPWLEVDMMSFARALSLFVALALAAGPLDAARVRQDDNEALKKKILEQVEKRLKDEEERLLQDIQKVIEEELNRKRTLLPEPAPKPPAPPAPVKPPAVKPEPAAPVKPVPPSAPEVKSPGFLGILMADLSADDKKDLGTSGVRVQSVLDNGPAHAAGLKKDDVLTAVNGKPVGSAQDIRAAVHAAGAGAKLKVDYLRDGKRGSVEVTLGRPAAEPQAQDDRERVKKFLDEREKAPAPQAEAPKVVPAPPRPPAQNPSEGLLDQLLEQLKPALEQFGMDPEEFFPKGDDGGFKFSGKFDELLKGLDLRKLFGQQPAEEPAVEPEPAPKKPAPAPPRKVEPAPPSAWLGMEPGDVSDELRAQLEIEADAGLLVTDVIEGSPAAAAGLKKNDILLQIDGKKVKGEETLAAFMASAKPGQKAALTVVRKGKSQSLEVTLGERKE